MKNKLLNRCAIGFLLGMVMVMLIPALTPSAADGRVSLVGERLIARVGSQTGALLLSLALYGLFGAFCVGGTLLYEIQRWPLALATAVHYLGLTLGYVTADLVLCWEMSVRGLLFVEGFMTLGFFLIWLILYLGYKKEVRELNRLTEKNRKDGTEKIKNERSKRDEGQRLH